MAFESCAPHHACFPAGRHCRAAGSPPAPHLAQASVPVRACRLACCACAPVPACQTVFCSCAPALAHALPPCAPVTPAGWPRPGWRWGTGRPRWRPARRGTASRPRAPKVCGGWVCASQGMPGPMHVACRASHVNISLAPCQLSAAHPHILSTAACLPQGTPSSRRSGTAWRCRPRGRAAWWALTASSWRWAGRGGAFQGREANVWEPQVDLNAGLPPLAG